MDWAQVIVTFAAVIVGAAASTVGTIVARRIEVRETRLELLRANCRTVHRLMRPDLGASDDEIVADTLGFSGLANEQTDAILEVCHVAALCGPRISLISEGVFDKWGEIVRAQGTDRPPSPSDRDDLMDRMTTLGAEASDLLRAPWWRRRR